MANIQDLFKSSNGTALAIGVGAAVLAPVVVSLLGGAARPLARAAIKSGIILYEKGRETFAEFGEVMDDLVAEARAEMSKGHEQAAAAVQQAAEGGQ